MTHDKSLDKLRFFVYFECPKCGEFLDYASNSYCEEGERILFCKCNWEKRLPLVSRFVNYNPEKGRFTAKWGENKKTRAVRLTDEAWNKLEEIASKYGVNRADLLECWARSLTEDEVTQFAFEQQIRPRIGDVVLSSNSK